MMLASHDLSKLCRGAVIVSSPRLKKPLPPSFRQPQRQKPNLPACRLRPSDSICRLRQYWCSWLVRWSSSYPLPAADLSLHRHRRFCLCHISQKIFQPRTRLVLLSHPMASTQRIRARPEAERVSGCGRLKLRRTSKSSLPQMGLISDWQFHTTATRFISCERIRPTIPHPSFIES